MKISFHDLQEAITSQISIPKKKYATEEKNGMLYLNSEKYSYVITKKENIIQAKKKQDKFNIELRFENYQNANNFPRTVFLKLESNDLKEALEMSLNYSKVQINQHQKIAFEIPDLYNEIE